MDIKKKIKRVKEEAIKELLYLTPSSRPKKLLFDHLPKCGGMSLNTYLKANYPIRKTYFIYGLNVEKSLDDFKNWSERKRYRCDLIKGHLANELINYVHPECLKVTMLREPVERIISHYYFVKRTPEHYLYSQVHDSKMSLEDYVTSDLSGELRNWYTTHFSGLTVDEAERNPEESVNKVVEILLNRYDIIGFLDQFSSFTDTLRQQANLRYEYQNERVNVTEDRPLLDDIPPSVISKIEQVNHLDITFYKRIKEAVG